jgi:hypothetical protein
MRKISLIAVFALVLGMQFAFAQTDQQSQPQTYPQTQQSQPQTYPPAQPTQEPQVQPRTEQQATQQQQQVVSSNNPAEIPAGTDLFVRTDEEITAKTADPQRNYRGTVTRQIVNSDGRVLIPKGTPVELSVFQNEGGTVKSNELVLGVNSMNINGQSYRVNTAELKQSNDQGIGKNKRTATHVGGGAVLGTVIGAVAGGGKGAAIGAISGAAAGGAVQVLTKGKEIKVPAETELQFHLDQPIQLQSYNP